MAVPKKRTSSTRRDKRRSHHALKPMNLIECPSCGAKMQAHRVCPECGSYKGRTIVNVEK